MLLVSSKSSSSENVPAIDEKEAEKTILVGLMVVFSPLLDRGSAVSVENEQCEIIN